MRIARQALELGADISYAKIWVPHLDTSAQLFHKDTPILMVNTLDQLRQTIGALRTLNGQGGLLWIGTAQYP